MNNSLNSLTYDKFKWDIMTLALMPGDPVSAAKIAERYKVSRTPAREALVKLETEALVDIYPQSGSVISKIDETRARQEWFVRKTLEMAVVDGLFANATKEDTVKMREFCSKMETVSKHMNDPAMIYEYLKCDNDFHAVSFYVSGQGLAAEIVSNTMAHYNRIRLLVDMQNTNKDRTLSTHEQLIRCIENNDREEYRAILSKHIGNFESDIKEVRKMKPELFKD
ncbi:MAG: GntR family transcriptional regulator [Lachnospiraceae bacterium]|nr:GntR family transcriptional regulator [Lachnospiraceae bacterium]